MAHVAPDSQSTQQAEPGRASWRTVVQSALGTIVTLGVVVPLVVAIIGEELGDVLPEGWYAWLLGASAVVGAVAGAVARIMAIPQVDEWLSRLHLSSSASVTKER